MVFRSMMVFRRAGDLKEYGGNYADDESLVLIRKK
jgi:hypothetical protein